MAKGNKKLSVVYPEEKEGRRKDANQKLKAENRSLKKRLAQMETELKTLSRAFNKSCQFIQEKLEHKNLSDVLSIVDDFDYKETRKGQEREDTKQKTPIEHMNINICPDCKKGEDKGFKKMTFGSIIVKSCVCGYRSKEGVENEGMQRTKVTER